MIPIVKTRVAMLAALLSIAALAGPAAQGGQPPAAQSARPAAAQLTGSIKNEGGEAMAGASVTMTDAQQRTAERGQRRPWRVRLQGSAAGPISARR